jgi:DNA-binding LacI/PurR family transcriptional regulator
MRNRKPKKKSPNLTMDDLAGLAGVSKITVSRALRDSPLVRDEVRARIQGLAKAKGYRLNSSARSLRLMRTHSVSVVIELEPSPGRPVSEPTVMAMLAGLLEELTTAGYRVVLTTRRQMATSTEHDSDGIILLGQGASDEATQRLRGTGVPLVVWGVPQPGDDDVVFVGSDNETGGVLAAQHLVDQGRRHLLYLGDPAHPEVAARLKGARSVTDRTGAKLIQYSCDFTAAAGREAVTQVSAKGARFDGVVTCSDAIAVGAIDGLRSLGLGVPRDVSVVGYDDTFIAASSSPPLSAIRQDLDRAGHVMASKMLEWLAGEQPGDSQLPVSLVVRASSVP